jgi:hypothetical protein
VTVAVFAGSLLAGNPLLAVLVAIVTVLVIGATIELIGRAVSKRTARRVAGMSHDPPAPLA